MRGMKIAAVQMVSAPEWAANRDAAARLVARAARDGAGLVLLPEYFCLLGRKDTDKLTLAESPGDGPIQRFLSDTAREHGVWLLGGTLPVSTGTEGRVLNRCCAYAPDGSEAAHYDKLHLFAFDNGGERYDEGRTLQAGSAPVALQAGPLRVGLSICYDLRFAELYRALSFTPGQSPCDAALSVPAAFTYTTGAEALGAAAAGASGRECSAFVLASPPRAARHENGRRTWGHSMVVDPWGRVLDVLPEGEGVVVAEVDPQCIAQVRLQLPALQHRRL